MQSWCRTICRAGSLFWVLIPQSDRWCPKSGGSDSDNPESCPGTQNFHGKPALQKWPRRAPLMVETDFVSKIPMIQSPIVSKMQFVCCFLFYQIILAVLPANMKWYWYKLPICLGFYFLFGNLPPLWKTRANIYSKVLLKQKGCFNTEDKRVKATLYLYSLGTKILVNMILRKIKSFSPFWLVTRSLKYWLNDKKGMLPSKLRSYGKLFQPFGFSLYQF